MEQSNLRKFYIIGGILGIILLALVAWFLLDFKSLYRAGAFHRARHAHYNAAVTSPIQIQDWMTFRYINYVFKLPANYLKDKLNISSPYYPNLVIGKQLLPSVKQAINQ